MAECQHCYGEHPAEPADPTAFLAAYHAIAARQWADCGLYKVHKSWRHPDGELCFDGGWFVVQATLPTATDLHPGVLDCQPRSEK